MFSFESYRVTTYHGWITNNLKSKIYKFIDKLIARFFSEINTVSEKLKSQLVNALIPARRITVIHNALMLERYKIDRSDRTLKKELDLPEESILILNIGRLSPEKGQDILIRAAVKIIMIGSNPK